VEYDRHLEAVELQTRALVEVLAGGHLDTTVPSCPDWTLRDLATHVGEFTGFWTHVLCEGTGRPKPAFDELPLDSPPAVADWYQGVAAHLVDELRATAPDTKIWTWVPDDDSARFAARRCAHELAVHRFDMELARGRPEPIEADLAADGIEEMFVMAGVRFDPTGDEQNESLSLHDTDGDLHWVLTLTPQGLHVDRKRANGDLTVRGSASDLELLLYRRPTLDELELSGDRTALEAWYRAFRFD
jgi:uncharacterized protein (TIGR03083 family)